MSPPHGDFSETMVKQNNNPRDTINCLQKNIIEETIYYDKKKILKNTKIVYTTTLLSVATQQTFFTSQLTLYHAANTTTLFTKCVSTISL